MKDYVKGAVAIANDNSHGYSQAQRWGPDYDCSSMVIKCLEDAGIPVKKYGASYTGDLGQALAKCGAHKVAVLNLQTGEGLKYGDILLNPQTHVEIYAGNGQSVGAHCSETGGKTGKPGDQTGNEISVQPYRNKNYTEVWRFVGFNPSTDTGATPNTRPLWDVVSDVIRGKYGNGEDRINNMLIDGFTARQIDLIQQGVNIALAYESEGVR